MEPVRHITFDRGRAPERLDRFLADQLPDLSRSQLKKLIDEGGVLLQGIPAKAGVKLRGGESLQVTVPDPIPVATVSQDIPLRILYEDRHLIVVDKPAGMVVHPHGNYSGTLVNALAFHLKQNHITDIDDPRLGLVHRIDKDTSGLLLVAKTPEAKTLLSAQFFRKETQRLYVALVWGNITEESGTIEGHIGRDPRDRMRMRVFPDGDQGKAAVTHYTVLERFGYVTLVQCRLETGRTHQIRAHMKHIGHPLFNDERYGGNEILRGTHFARYKQFVYNCFALCPRQCLHARTLGFVHPVTKEACYFDSKIPEDMQAVIDRWRTYTSSRVEME